jgi:hypothetical protein
MAEEPRQNEKNVPPDSLSKIWARLNQGQNKWAIRIMVPVVVLIIILILLSIFGILSSENATVVGAVVALIGVLITQTVNTYIAQANQKHQRELENQRAQDNALEKYLDQLSDQETYEDLRKATEGGYKRALMRAKMQTLLLALDGGRKSILLLFLNEAKLIKKREYLQSYDKNERRWNYPILGLEGIDFSDAKFGNSIVVDFADLSGANLSNTDLSGATLRGVNLHDADLGDANLSKAKLLKANRCELDPHKKREGPIEDLLKMDLSKANLQRANLTGANLQGANLQGADLTGADLTGADLTGANGLTKELIEWTIGSNETKLGEALNHPELWSKSIDEQIEIVREHSGGG